MLILAPESIVDCVREFVASIRREWNTLAEPLAKALDRDNLFVEGLLDIYISIYKSLMIFVRIIRNFKRLIGFRRFFVVCQLKVIWNF